MGIGIDTGRVIAGNIGDERHMKYGVVGAAINVAARLETFTLGNQVLVSHATKAQAGEDLVTDEPLEFRAKGRREPLRAYPVRGLGPDRMPDELAHLHVDVDLPGTVFRVDGKQVDSVAHEMTVVRIEPDTLTVRTGLALAERDGVKVAIVLEGRRLDELYAVVESLGKGVAVLRLTSVPTEQRAVLEAFVEERAGEATGSTL
jgi:adenylate cyclase